MGRARDISKVFSTNTALATDSEVSAFNYLTQSSASTVYQTKAATGLTLIKTQTFSSVSAVNVDDVFNTTYENYRIIISHKNVTSQDACYLRFRSGSPAADNSTSNYYWAGHFVESSYSNITLAKGDPATSARIGVTALEFSLMDILITNPFQSEKTTFIANCGYGLSSNEGGYNTEGGYINLTTSFTGFSIVPGSGTISGSVSAYGFNK
jgi:hypothetical protein